MGWRKPVLVLVLGVAVVGAAVGAFVGAVYLRYRAVPAALSLTKALGTPHDGLWPR